MELVHGLPQPINDRPTVLTIGVFDGVHRGHQQLISSAVTRARALGIQSAVLTFDPHPDTVIHADRPQRILASLDERARLIADLGADILAVLPFTEATKGLSAESFMTSICGALALRELWVGYDFALGRRREGDLPRLQEIGRTLGYTVHPVAPLLIGGQPISSSRIRAALDEGAVEAAADLLGHDFAFSGKVVDGDKRGRTIGFPTANIDFPETQMLPDDGIYVCYAEVRGVRYGAATNVGVRPTFNGQQRRVEAYLLDFSDDIYGETLRLTFKHRLRGEAKFDSVAELITQMGIDTQNTREWLASH